MFIILGFSASLIRLKGEEEHQKKEEEKARREYIKDECLRKQQLKLMDDMDSVIKPRPPSVKQKKPRPKSMHRDIMESPKPPARTTTGTMRNPDSQPFESVLRFYYYYFNNIKIINVYICIYCSYFYIIIIIINNNNNNRNNNYYILYNLF